jgi:spermidine synthase
MQPWEIAGRARAPDGTELLLARRGVEWVVRAGGRVLMSSRLHGSEEALAALALERMVRPRTVLIGGLGLGYTLRAALDRLPPQARVVVAELMPEVAAWNRGPVAHLAGRPLDDPRVRLQIGDVAGRIGEARAAFDAILLDVDNGASPIGHPANKRLYGSRGVRACAEALHRGGVLGVWSAGPDEPYRERLERAGLEARSVVVPARHGGGGRHVLIVARKPAHQPAAKAEGRVEGRPAEPAPARPRRFAKRRGNKRRA